MLSRYPQANLTMVTPENANPYGATLGFASYRNPASTRSSDASETAHRCPQGCLLLLRQAEPIPSTALRARARPPARRTAKPSTKPTHPVPSTARPARRPCVHFQSDLSLSFGTSVCAVRLTYGLPLVEQHAPGFWLHLSSSHIASRLSRRAFRKCLCAPVVSVKL